MPTTATNTSASAKGSPASTSPSPRPSRTSSQRRRRRRGGDHVATITEDQRRTRTLSRVRHSTGCSVMRPSRNRVRLPEVLAKTEVQALLEDGPKHLSDLEEALGLRAVTLIRLLDQLRAPACDGCRRRFLAGAGAAARYCSRECARRERPSRGTPSLNGALATPSDRDRVEPAMPAASLASSDQVRRTIRRPDAQYEVIWDGVGPLPGAGGAEGLGSTLSGNRFSIGKRM